MVGLWVIYKGREMLRPHLCGLPGLWLCIGTSSQAPGSCGNWGFGILCECWICQGVSSYWLYRASRDTEATIFLCLTLGSCENLSPCWWRHCLDNQGDDDWYLIAQIINIVHSRSRRQQPIAWHVPTVTCLLVRLLMERGLLVFHLQPSPPYYSPLCNQMGFSHTSPIESWEVCNEFRNRQMCSLASISDGEFAGGMSFGLRIFVKIVL